LSTASYDLHLVPHSIRRFAKPPVLNRQVENAYVGWGKGRKTYYRGKPTRWYARLATPEAKADHANQVGAAVVAASKYGNLLA
jgi:hypothetical protein